MKCCRRRNSRPIPRTTLPKDGKGPDVMAGQEILWQPRRHDQANKEQREHERVTGLKHAHFCPPQRHAPSRLCSLRAPRHGRLHRSRRVCVELESLAALQHVSTERARSSCKKGQRPFTDFENRGSRPTDVVGVRPVPVGGARETLPHTSQMKSSKAGAVAAANDLLDILPKQLLRAPPAPPASPWPSASAAPFVLLGLVSCDQRHAEMRCGARGSGR